MSGAGEERLAALERALAGDPDNQRVFEALVRELVRGGREEESFRLLFGNLGHMRVEDIQRLAGLSLPAGEDAESRQKLARSLVEAGLRRRAGDRLGVSRSMVALLSACHEREGRDDGLIDSLKRLWTGLDLELVDHLALRSSMLRLRSAIRLPSRELLRFCLFFVLREAVPADDELDQFAFDSVLGQAKRTVFEAYRIEWRPHLDSSHTRRYMCQYGLVDRTPDGRAYWRSDRYEEKVGFTKEARELVTAWWRGGARGTI